jgi:hypothetical protein
MRLTGFAAPAPSTASAPERFATWEQGVGYKLAGLCSVMTQMMIEREADGRVKEETRNEGGELLIELVRLKLFIKDDFDAIARKHAIEALTEHIAAPPDPMPPDEAAISSLVDHALKLLTSFIKEKVLN